MRAAQKRDGIPQIVRPSRETLKKVHALKAEKGRIAAIEPESGEYFLAENLIAALERGRKRYPQGTFYFVRVGHPTAHVHHGGLRRKKP